MSSFFLLQLPAFAAGAKRRHCRLPDVNARVFPRSLHRERLAGAGLAVRQNADVVAVHARRHKRFRVLVNLTTKFRPSITSLLTRARKIEMCIFIRHNAAGKKQCKYIAKQTPHVTTKVFLVCKKLKTRASVTNRKKLQMLS